MTVQEFRTIFLLLMETQRITGCIRNLHNDINGEDKKVTNPLTRQDTFTRQCKVFPLPDFSGIKTAISTAASFFIGPSRSTKVSSVNTAMEMQDIFLCNPGGVRLIMTY